jgi:RHH-type proline utilization regulon transcriptional repressor/proline dehydrogenase/delta 1-pyrroline-5-carboxylate dehydrogenase
VAPEFVDDRKYILKPTVKWGVKPSSYTFQNELFAPLLSVVCIDDLEQGIAYANSSEYGLTAGLQSLNEEEQTLWKNSIEAGNLYINRGITGAIVNRQPFGGMKRSAFGGGIKAGGPNYVSNFVEFTENKVWKVDPSTSLSDFTSNDRDRDRVNFAYTNYQQVWENEFSQEKDVNHIYGEENIFRYLPLKNMGFRVQEKDSLADILLVMIAAHICRTPLTISISAEDKYLEVIEKAAVDYPTVTIRLQDESTFLNEMDTYERIRTCTSDLSDDFYQKAAKLGKHIANKKPIIEGRIELLHYLKEQSIAYEYHRYGSIFGSKE